MQLIDSLVTGGKERQFVSLLNGLQNETGIFCQAVVMSDRIEYENFHALGIDTVVLRRRARYDPSIFRKLYRTMRGFEPDIVHSWNSMCSIYGAPVAKLLGAKFVDGFVRAAPPHVGFRDKDYIRSRLTRPLTDVTVGNSLAGLAAYRIPDNQAVCICNGFDFTRLERLATVEETRRSLGIETKLVVGMTGAFSEWKDHATFFAMARRILSLRDDVTFLAIGDGPRLSSFKAACRDLDSRRLKLLGRRSDVESIVKIFTVGVLASSFGEGISNAIMEYMALGKPVVATDSGGTREIVEDGASGFLVPSGNAAAMTDCVLRLLNDAALARGMGERGRQIIRDEFSMERMTRRHMELYRDLAAAHGNAVPKE